MPSQPIALYVHVPFCETRCPYCDFNTYAGIEHMIPGYVEALTQELRMWGKALACNSQRQTVGTVFFGGGTPSYLPSAQIHRLMNTIRTSFDLATDAEVTLESNPGDVKSESLAGWKAAGVNRLSIGVQSLDDGLLRLLGRRHNAEGARQAYLAARSAGFDNVSLDLMFGLPYQTQSQWRDTLDNVLEMRPDHLSMYCLTLEEGTPLEAWVRQGTVPEPDPDLAADMYTLAHDLASDAGYQRCEISNWALAGRASRHNLTYWHNQPYLGVGPGAHSYLQGHRFAVVRSPRQYVQRIIRTIAESSAQPGKVAWNIYDLQKHGLLETVEEIDTPLEMAETMIMGLRLAEGVSEAGFRERFGTGLRQVYEQQINDLLELGLLRWRNDALMLTPRGWFLSNEVFLRFVA